MMNMLNSESAIAFCRMSFEPSFWPCVETFTAAKIFNIITYSNFGETDFNALLVELFGEESDAGQNIFRLKRKNFYCRAYQALENNDFKTFDALADELDNAAKAMTVFEGGDLIDLHS